MTFRNLGYIKKNTKNGTLIFERKLIYFFAMMEIHFFDELSNGMKSLISWSINLFIPLFNVLILVLPFWLMRKIKGKNISWKNLFFCLFFSVVGFLIWEFFTTWLYDWIYKNVYNSYWLLDAMMSGLIGWVLTGLFILLLPYIFCYFKYGKFTQKRFSICILISIGLGILTFIGFIYFMVAMMGQAGQRYF